MELKGKKWENYSTEDVDRAKGDSRLIEWGLDKLNTLSLIELRNAIDDAINNYKINNVDPSQVPVFIKFDNFDYVFNNFSWCVPPKCIIESDQSSKLIYTAPDSRPKIGEYWKSRGASDWDCSGFVVSKLAGERLLRLVKYVLETDKPESWLDFREREPNWIQFKFSAKEFNVNLLDELSREAGGIVTEEILRACKKYRQKERM